MDLQLRERTVLITGNFSTTIQGLVHSLTQLGADVVLWSEDAEKSQRFCSQISDAREINPKFGRATSLSANFSSVEKIKSGLSDAARIFGGLDIYIDAMITNAPSPLNIGEVQTEIPQLIQKSLTTSIEVTNQVLNYLKNRKRGRIIYLMNESSVKYSLMSQAEIINSSARSALIQLSKALSKQVLEYNITVNVLSLGLTEESLLANSTDKTIKEALENFRLKDPTLRITEPDKIANAAAYLVSQLGSAITGQVIELS